MTLEPYLSLIIPVYNEADHIENCMRAVDSFVETFPKPTEVIFVDDGSTDNTKEFIADHIATGKKYQLLLNESNLGKGASVKRGMLAASGQYRLFSDTDLSTPLNEVLKLLPLVENEQVDVVLGSRRVPGAQLDKRQPFIREAIGRIFSILVRLLTVPGFLDTQCGFKLFRKTAAVKIFSKLQTTGFAFDVEVVYLAVKVLGLNVVEAPVRWTNSPSSRVSMLSDPLKMLRDILRIPKNQY